jgi:hypothetical protein
MGSSPIMVTLLVMKYLFKAIKQNAKMKKAYFVG